MNVPLRRLWLTLHRSQAIDKGCAKIRDTEQSWIVRLIAAGRQVVDRDRHRDPAPGRVYDSGVRPQFLERAGFARYWEINSPLNTGIVLLPFSVSGDHLFR